MTSAELRKKYQPTIGIECHVQLATKTKLFAPVDNDARGAAPNTKVSVICLGMPGVLPVLNQAAVDLSIRAGLVLDAEVASVSVFDRKHYFYPDLPKGYQITQFTDPIVGRGLVRVPIDDNTLDVRITRAHLEEDAGKSTHPAGSDYSLVDLNRAGTPLLEIVSEPDMHTAQEARAYAHELYLLMKYAAVSDVDLYHGNMRFDVNVSIAPLESNDLGTRSETKNLNSFRSVERAVEFEIDRQIALLEKGEAVAQETRGWDEAKGKTFSQRSKEDAHDYRYFPDADLPPVVIDEAQIAEARAKLPLLPKDFRSVFAELGLDRSTTETLIESPAYALAIHQLASESKAHATRVAQWLVNVVHDTSLDPPLKELVQLSDMVEQEKLSSTNAKEVFLELMKSGGKAQQIAESKQLLQVSDESALTEVVRGVIKENPKAADDVRGGEMKAIGFLVGQVMKASKGQANPGVVQSLIKGELSGGN